MASTILGQFKEYDRKIFWTLVGLGVFSLFLYAYFISISVVAVIARKDAERELGRITTRVATLESAYVSLDKTIDLQLAHAEGFLDVSLPRYITTAPRESGLSIHFEASTP